MMMLRHRWLAGAAAATMAAATSAQAQVQTQPSAPPPADEVYELGELVVTARNRQGEAVGGDTISADDMRRFDRVSLDQALDLVAGVSSGSTGGSRNERLVYIRGFDRSRPPCRSTGSASSSRPTTGSTLAAS